MNFKDSMNFMAGATEHKKNKKRKEEITGIPKAQIKALQNLDLKILENNLASTNEKHQKKEDKQVAMALLSPRETGPENTEFNTTLDPEDTIDNDTPEKKQLGISGRATPAA